MTDRVLMTTVDEAREALRDWLWNELSITEEGAWTDQFDVFLAAFEGAVMDREREAAESAETLRALRRGLERLRDHGYQPMYNGRPSCPFCSNFVDDEETHKPRCSLVVALAATPAEDGR